MPLLITATLVLHRRHYWKYEILLGRRRSTYFIPIAQPKLKVAQKQAALDLNIQHRAEENKLINDLRERVSHWRQNY